jgi:hypothetical protein
MFLKTCELTDIQQLQNISTGWFEKFFLGAIKRALRGTRCLAAIPGPITNPIDRVGQRKIKFPPNYFFTNSANPSKSNIVGSNR